MSCRAVEGAPLCAGAHVAQGLVHEARNSNAAAAECYMKAQALLEHLGNCSSAGQNAPQQADWVIHSHSPAGSHEAISLEAAVQVC